jgi:tetratricopeptide (TPR) repeat protein
MSLRQNLSPNNKFALICAGLAILVAAEGAWLLSQSKNEPLQVATNSVATPPAQGSIPTPTATPEQLFTVPGLKASPDTAKSPVLSAKPNTPLTSPIPTNPPKGLVVPPKTANSNLPDATQQRAKAAFDRGAAALKAKDLPTALAAFREVVGLAPDDVATRLNLSLIYGAMNQPQNALPHLQKAAQLQPKNAPIQFNLGRTYLALKKPDQALPYLRKTVQLAPKERESRALLGEVLLNKRQPKEAYPHFAFLANADKKDIQAHLTAAAIANDVLNKPKEAERLLRRANEGNPREPQPAIMLAQLLAGQKKPKEAVKVLSAAVKARPDVYELYPPLAEARSAAGDAKGATDALKSAIMRLPVGKTDKEKEALKVAQAELRIALGRTLGNSKKTKEALVEFEKASQLFPKAAEPKRLAAIAALQLKQTSKAIDLLESALKIDPKRDDNRRLLAQTLASEKKWKESDAQWAIYNSKQPKDVDALLIWAQVADQMKNKARQLEIAKKMTVAAPKDPFAWGQLAVLQKRNGDNDEALNSLKTLQKLQPKSPDAAYEIALLQTQKGNQKEAFDNWRIVLENRPEYKDGYSPMLEAADKAEQNGTARAFLVRVLAKKPENLDALNEILKFYEKKNQTNEAKLFLTDLIERDPNQKSAKTILASFEKAKP